MCTMIKKAVGKAEDSEVPVQREAVDGARSMVVFYRCRPPVRDLGRGQVARTLTRGVDTVPLVIQVRSFSVTRSRSAISWLVRPDSTASRSAWLRTVRNDVRRSQLVQIRSFATTARSTGSVMASTSSWDSTRR